MPLAAKIAATALIPLLGGLVLACDLVTPSGEVATARLCVDPGPDPSLQDFLVAEAIVARYAALTGTRSVMEAVIGQLGLDEDPESLRGRISTATSDEELLLTIEVRDEDHRAARVLALALGDEMIRRVHDAQVEPEPIKAIPPEGLHDSIREFEERIRKRVADGPDQPERPPTVRNLLVWCEKPAAPEPSSPAG